MKAATIIRLFSVLGILTLLVLQYVWFKNSFNLMENEFLSKSQTLIDRSIEDELYNRININKSKVLFSEKKLDASKSSIEVKETDDINLALQEFANQEGKLCSPLVLDSFYIVYLNESMGFVPKHSLRLIDAKTKENSKSNKYTFYGKLTDNQYAEVILVNPLGSILKQAQLIVILSIFLVIIIGFVLMYLLRSTLREAKFVTFIKEYTHALTHELKTPLSGIYIASSQLASGILEDKPESRQKYYAVCRESSSKLLSTVDRILLVAKAEHSRITTNPINVEVKPYIEKIVDAHRKNNFRQKEVILSTSCEPADLMGSFDEFLMENVLNNLIDNAMKYSEKSVNIDVSALIVDGFLEFKVKDTGFGISENELKHVFDNFERGDKVQRKGIDGFGIGLNYVNKVVRAHKGTIRVESQEGKGTEFFIHLPYKKDSTIN